MSILINQEVLRTLEQGADLIVTEAKANAKTQRIKDNMFRDSAKQESPTSASVRIWINTNSESGAPEAPAYEYGSGVHSTRGPQTTYEITPKTKSILKFPYKERREPRSGGWPNYQLAPGESVPPENFYFTFVNHPGVAAQPYMKPAFEAKKGEIAGLLLKAIRGNISSHIKLIWNEVMKS